MQNAKIEFPQTFSQESPLETIEENTTFSSLGFIFFKYSDFLIFTPREAMEPLKNVLRICDPCKKTKTRIKTILLLDNLMTFPLQITVIRIGKDSNLNFF